MYVVILHGPVHFVIQKRKYIPSLKFFLDRGYCFFFWRRGGGEGEMIRERGKNNRFSMGRSF